MAGCETPILSAARVTLRDSAISMRARSWAILGVKDVSVREGEVTSDAVRHRFVTARNALRLVRADMNPQPRPQDYARA